MEKKRIGLSRDLIIHPGETLEELLESRDMSQKELAVRTGYSAKHISEVINGKKNISPEFAKKLENVFGISAGFWLNLQTKYDIELLEYNEIDSVTQEELDIIKEAKPIIKLLKELHFLPENAKNEMYVLLLRAFCNLNNLGAIPKLMPNCAYRKANNGTINPYTLFIWQRMCEKKAEQINVDKELDVEVLKEKIPQIRALMLKDVNTMQIELKRIFAECGIKFCIVKNVRGAPVQGFIERTIDGEIILCMTIRGKRADIFWFTLFHEIAHILFNHIDNHYIDFEKATGEEEEVANKYASDILIDPTEFQLFLLNPNCLKLSCIQAFSKSQKIPSYIVIGRLQRMNLLRPSQFVSEMLRYEWR